MNNSLRKINAMINSVTSNININNYFSIDNEPADIKINQEEPHIEVVEKPKLNAVVEEPKVEEPKVEEPKVEEPKEEVVEEPKEEVKEEIKEEKPKPSLADLSWTTVKAKKKRRGKR